MTATPKEGKKKEKGKELFHGMNLSPSILNGLHEMGFEQPTPIQKVAIPLIMEGKDLLGQAKTGTGKTAAFGIPLLSRPIQKKGGIIGLVLVPTRELALQVRDEIENIGKHTPHKVVAVFGGASMQQQADGLARNPSIIVGTPGRMQDFMRQGKLVLNQLQTVVLDEADKMLDMGFKEDIERILGQTPPERQTLLFSATMPTGIRHLAKKYMKNPIELNLSEDTLTVEGITQYYLNVDPKQRITMLLGLIKHFNITKGLVFCSTKRTVDWLETQLSKRHIPVAKIHGDMPQNKRQYFLHAFEEGKYTLLLATNVAARGIHIEDITHVINFDFPEEYETYVHRVGRTARQGKKGVAITFVTNMSDVQRIKELEILMNAKVHELKAK
ncbi:MAG: DEAD/DEAH box helicase [Candidatus Diapherotrites archaeon]